MARSLASPLRDAITSKFMRLTDRDEQLFQGCGPSISVRLSVRTILLLFLRICVVPVAHVDVSAVEGIPAMEPADTHA